MNTFKPAIITKFPSGLARKSEVTYVSTASTESFATYSDDDRLDPGTAYMAMPLRVVASISTEDGTASGTMASTNYHYHALRGSPTGRGSQGFRTMSVTEPSGITTTTTFAQAYPYTGEWQLTLSERSRLPFRVWGRRTGR